MPVKSHNSCPVSSFVPINSLLDSAVIPCLPALVVVPWILRRIVLQVKSSDGWDLASESSELSVRTDIVTPNSVSASVS
jgi:hypothetical protein